jgi:hypothetical protein
MDPQSTTSPAEVQAAPLRTRRRVPAEDRFWSKVRKAGPAECWLWLGAHGKRSYGKFWDGSAYLDAHRFVWRISNGAIPDGLFVLHTCDVRLCVNPAHLWLGTHADNMRDMTAKGRQCRGEEKSRIMKATAARGEKNAWHTHPERMSRGEKHSLAMRAADLNPSRGENHYRAKLSDADVLLIRHLANCGFTRRQIAAQFGVSHVQITRIVNGNQRRQPTG